MSALDESEALHARVRAFGAAATRGESFEAIALDVARYQAKYNRGFARLVRARGVELASVDSIPAVPTDAFRLTRVATYPACATNPHASFFCSVKFQLWM